MGKGKTENIDTTPDATKKVRAGVTNFLTQPLQGQQNAQQVASQPGAGAAGGLGGPRPFSPYGRSEGSPFLQNYMSPGGPNIGPNGAGGMPPIADGGHQINADGTPMSGGPQPARDPFGVGDGRDPNSRIFAQDPGQVGNTQVNRVGDVSGFDRSGIRDVNNQNVNFDPSGIRRIDPNSIPQVGDGTNRGDVRNIRAGDLAGQSTQSVDQLGGANSAFFRNMQAQLQPAFDQQRGLAVAGAKEAAGNLSGSGYAGYVGGALNRSLGDEQARLADYASQGLQTEVGRQTSLAGINNQGNIARFQGDLDAQRSNQGADQTFMGQRLQAQEANQRTGLQANLANQQTDIESGRLGLQAGGMNQDANLRAQGLNQEADQNFIQQEMQRRFQNQSAGINQNQFQGGLDQQRLMAEYQARAAQGDQNAQRYLQLLSGQAQAGVGPNTVIKTPGLGQQLLQGAIQVAAAAAGGCWMADELYGEDDVRTHAARSWVAKHDNIFTQVYKKMGQQWVAWLREGRMHADEIQPIWDQMAEMGAAA